jgi:hypothetical protein
MIATYILIVLLHTGDAGFTAEFYTKDNCERAGKAVMAVHNYHSNYQSYMCVEK